jgi:hypothetical protein
MTAQEHSKVAKAMAEMLDARISLHHKPSPAPVNGASASPVKQSASPVAASQSKPSTAKRKPPSTKPSACASHCAHTYQRTNSKAQRKPAHRSLALILVNHPLAPFKI